MRCCRRIAAVFAVGLTLLLSPFVRAADKPEDVREEVLGAILRGEAEADLVQVRDTLDPGSVTGYLSALFSGELTRSGRVLPLLLAVLLAAAGIKAFLGEEKAKTAETVTLAALAAVSAALILPLIEAVSGYLAHFAVFISGCAAALRLFPAFNGAPAAGTVTAAGAAALAAASEAVAAGITVPAVRVLAAFSLIKGFRGVPDLAGIVNFIKSAVLWLLGVCFALFAGVHGCLFAAAGASDTLLLRTLRFSAARLIPVAGGMVNDSLKTVLAGMRLIRVGAGALGEACVLYAAASPIAAVLAAKLAVILSMQAARLLGLSPHAGLLEGLNGVLTLLLAAVLFAACGGIAVFAALFA